MTTFVQLWRATNVKLCPRSHDQASLQAIKAVFVTPLTLTFDTRQRFIWLASSNMSEICAKGVAKSAAKLLCLRLKSKACQRSGQMAFTWSLGQSCGKGVVKYDWNSSQKFKWGAAKYICFFSSPRIPLLSCLVLRVNSAFASLSARMLRYCLAWLISAWYTG